MYTYVYIYIYICMYILKRLSPLPPTSATRGMDAWMLECLSLCWPCGRFGTNLGCIIGGLCSPVVSLGMVPASLWEHLGSTGSGRVPN